MSDLAQHVFRSPARIPATESQRTGLCAAPPSEKRSTLSCIRSARSRAGGRASPQRGSSRFFEDLPRAVEGHVGEQLTLRQPGALVGRDTEQHVEGCREFFGKLDREAIGLGRLFDHRFGLSHRARDKPDYHVLNPARAARPSANLLFAFCSHCSLRPCTRRPSALSITCPTGRTASSNCTAAGARRSCRCACCSTARRCEFRGTAAAPALQEMQTATRAGLSLRRAQGAQFRCAARLGYRAGAGAARAA